MLKPEILVLKEWSCITELTAEKLRGLCHIMAVYLTTNNLLRLSGLFFGPKKKAYRDTLEWMWQEERVITIKDLVETKIVGSYSSARRILSYLLRIQCVYICNHELGCSRRPYFFRLYWSGRSYCRAFF